MKKKPKTPRTIADLKINWTFEHDESKGPYFDQERFQELNPELQHIKVKHDFYYFLIGKETVTVSCDGYYGTFDKTSQPLFNFIEALTWSLKDILKHQKLDRFELISENTFRIHTSPLT